MGKIDKFINKNLYHSVSENMNCVHNISLLLTSALFSLAIYISVDFKSSHVISISIMWLCVLFINYFILKYISNYLTLFVTNENTIIKYFSPFFIDTFPFIIEKLNEFIEKENYSTNKIKKTELIIISILLIIIHSINSDLHIRKIHTMACNKIDHIMKSADVELDIKMDFDIKSNNNQKELINCKTIKKKKKSALGLTYIGMLLSLCASLFMVFI